MSDDAANIFFFVWERHRSSSVAKRRGLSDARSFVRRKENARRPERGMRVARRVGKTRAREMLDADDGVERCGDDDDVRERELSEGER